MTRQRCFRLLIAAFGSLSATGWASVPLATPELGLQRVAEWVAETGTQTVVRSRVASALEVATTDVPVRERGFHVIGTRLTHVCSVSTAPHSGKVIFLALVDESDGSALVWRTNAAGHLLGTVQFSEGTIVKMSDDTHAADFAAEKHYFRAKTPAAGATFEPRGTSIRRGGAPFVSELMLIAWNPLVLPVILIVLMAGAMPIKRSRRISDDTR